MKTYLAHYILNEGEHEHDGYLLFCASSQTRAEAIAKTQEHEPAIPDDDEKITYWDYGDGTTAARLRRVTAITPAEVDTLQRLGVAYYFHQEPEPEDETPKKIFRVSAIETVYYPEMGIEADSREEAEAEYRKDWEHGCFLSPKYELAVTSAELEPKGARDE